MTRSDGLTIVLNGGWTAEAEVSRDSGQACLEAAREGGWKAEGLEMERDLPAKLLAARPARIFNALHGRVGEDGNVQGLLNLLGIPYTHSGLLASAIAMDKPASKAALAPLGIRFPEDVPFSVRDGRIRLDGAGPVVVKPRNDGSSVGVVLAADEDEIPPLADWPDGTELMVERFIPGRELTVAALDGEPLTVTEITQRNRFYDYEAKYSSGGSSHQLPADVPESVFGLCMEWAGLAHRGLGCRGVSRSDFRWDEAAGELFMLEINTQPGMTGTSLVPEQAALLGMDMPALVTRLLEAAQCD